MSNRFASFGLPQARAPLHRYGGRVQATRELGISPVSGDLFVVDGAGPIAVLPPSPRGTLITLLFTGATTLTHSSKLILPGGANIVTVANDALLMTPVADGSWQCLGVLRADGTPLAVAIATQAQAEAGTENTLPMTALRTAEAVVALTQGFKNIIRRNGGMEVWQRGAGSSANIAVAASITAYTADGWYLKTGANQACHVSAQAGLGDGSPLAAKVIRDSGQTGTGTIYFAFPLDTDELYRLRNKKIALSLRAKEGANQSFSHTLTYNLYCGTGAVAKRGSSTYTGETNPLTGTFTLSTSDAAFVSGLSSTIASNITQAELQVSIVPSGTAGADDSFTIDDVQIEVIADGVVPATPLFERLGFGETLALCERFFQKSTNYGTAILQNTDVSFVAIIVLGTASFANNLVYADYPLFRRMRATPTVTTYPFTTAANTGRCSNNAGTDYGANSCAINTVSDTAFSLTNTSGGALTISGSLVIFSWYASAEI